MPRDPKRKIRIPGPGTSLGARHRSRVLQPTQQRPAVPVEYLLAFIRAMIRNQPSRDAISLAARSADHQVPITDAQKESFAKAVAYEVDQSVWPKGFF